MGQRMGFIYFEQNINLVESSSITFYSNLGLDFRGRNEGSSNRRSQDLDFHHTIPFLRIVIWLENVCLLVIVFIRN